MSATAVQNALADSSPPRVRRKPAPSVVYPQQPSTPSHVSQSPSQTQLHQPCPQQVTQPFHKLSFSERYPEPDPTDPFAPLWVLRNRTSSALQRDALPATGPLLQRDPSTDEFGVISGYADRRRSISYLQTIAAASTRNVSDAAQPAYASDHGHGTLVRTQRAYSIDNGAGHATGNTIAPSVRRQSIRPTPLSQVTALVPSVSRGSINPDAPKPTHIRIIQRPLSAENDDNSSGTESDSTRVGNSGTDLEMTPRPAAQRQHREHQEQEQRPRAGSANKLTRFLKTRKVSHSDSNSHNVRASIADINRIRKASISPPVYSTVVWASQGQDFLPIDNHPLQRNAIPILASQADTVPSPIRETPDSAHTTQGSLPAVAPVPIRHLPSPSPEPVPLPVPDQALLSSSSTPLPPHALTSRPSQTSHTAHTDETHSSFSFVHVPSAFSSPSLAQLTSEYVRQAQAQGTLSRPATAPLLEHEPGPGVAATIASPATMKIKRSTSRPTSKLPPPHPSPINSGPLLSSSPLSSNYTISQYDSTQARIIGEWDLPTFSALTKAASLPIIAESGVRINFGALFAQQRVVVVFIRHFWCPLCQDYMSSVASFTRHIPELLGSSGNEEMNEKVMDGDGEGDREIKGESVKVVVVSNGSYTMIGKYKQIFGAVSLEVYTDPSLAVYAALGMGKDPASLPDHGHGHGRLKGSGQAHLNAEVLAGGGGGGGKGDKAVVRGRRHTDGGYVKHGLMSGIAMVFVRALKVGMPVWEKGGDLNQLGGEFVFGPGLVCTYAHRMQTTKGHAPFEDVLRAAGVIVPPLRPLHSPKDQRDKEQDRKPNSLRKSRPSNASKSSKTRVKAQTIDFVPVPVPALPSPTTPTPVVKASPSQSSTTPERKKSHRRRRSVLRSPTGGVSPTVAASVSVSAKVILPQVKVSVQSEKEEDKDVPVHTTTSANVDVITSVPASRPTPNAVEQRTETTAPMTVTTSTKQEDPAIDPEIKWMEERHRSLQKIKERKNARRGLSLVDERQATASMTMSLSHSHSRSPSNSLSPLSSLPPSPSQTLASQTRQRQRSGAGSEVERTHSRRRHGSSGSGLGRGSGEELIDLGVQSDTGMVMHMRREMSRSGRSLKRDDDDTVLLGKEARMSRVNLSRDYLVRREREREKERELLAAAGVPVQVEDDAETLSDKTLVHQ